MAERVSKENKTTNFKTVVSKKWFFKIFFLLFFFHSFDLIIFECI